MKIQVVRCKKTDSYTEGNLYIDDKFICYTIEDTDRGLNNNMSEADIKAKKVYGETAIPTGTYKVDMNTVSPKFSDRTWAKPYGGKLPRLIGVKGFEGVLIHVGNSAKDSLGCLLVNSTVNNGVGAGSTAAFNKIMLLLLEAKAKGEEITIEIV